MTLLCGDALTVPLAHEFFFAFEYGNDCATHGRFRRALSRPDLILRKTLREKHLFPGNSLNPAAARDPQQFGRAWTIDHIHDQSAIQVRTRERRSAARIHPDRSAVHDGIEKRSAQIGLCHNFSLYRARQSACPSRPTRRYTAKGNTGRPCLRRRLK